MSDNGGHEQVHAQGAAAVEHAEHDETPVKLEGHEGDEAAEQQSLLEIEREKHRRRWGRARGGPLYHWPAAALRFPLCLQQPGEGNSIVRTILSIDEAAGTMTFAGNMPVGATVRLMRASQEELICGAEDAARSAATQATGLVFCVSCVGRRIVLGHRTDEEIECVVEIIGEHTPLIGFYSYGEITPVDGLCQLHNQTMTITTVREDIR
jgi:hypothetical protein